MSGSQESGAARAGAAEVVPVPDGGRRRRLGRSASSGDAQVIELARAADLAPPSPPAMSLLRRRREELRSHIHEGKLDAVRRQHSLGKLTARERLALLLDEDSFTELEPYRRHQATGPGLAGNHPHTDGVVAGSGTIDGRRVFVYAQDFTLFGGSLGEAHAAKIHKVLDLAVANGAPVIGLNDSGGARIQEGVLALNGYGGIFRRQVEASGVIPQISVVLGPCAGGAAYSPALADFTFMVRDTARMYLTGPDVVEAVSGQRVTHEELGGADVHGSASGVATVVHDDEESCLADVRYLVSLLPSNYLDPPPPTAPTNAKDDYRPRLAELVPVEPNQPYDMRDVFAEVADDGEFFELHEGWARNVLCALARIDGRVVGLVGNQPMVFAGVLDGPASQKAARFVRFCDAFGIPLVSLVDVPGFLPGVEQERGGIIRQGAQLLHAYCEATVPRIQVILRKAFGGAYIVMDSRSIGCDLSLAWPTNQIAVMGAEGAVNVLYRRDLAASADPAALRAKLVAEYTQEYLNPQYAAERGLVDDIIDPAETRAAVARGLAMLRDKRKPAPGRKHGNLPI
ncbi:acyl-CoA carboxylase subunit beta [Amycolatopsis mongoliensis]|uniref:Acyl-CoA carboxylase subunit beta n=1 Tax=Amycolatopsis mongoliensis TaxID=715475 RepID=A0A9Y2JRJ7_9PSEU|nr:acyl-CoA carboxylase subunit beta [Amycolatopsis sp. 4-36]WIY02259.1 acyl-CoA carboxylase subunit beta [Amycolatopsis sp. 4-36]